MRMMIFVSTAQADLQVHLANKHNLTPIGTIAQYAPLSSLPDIMADVPCPVNGSWPYALRSRLSLVKITKPTA